MHVPGAWTICLALTAGSATAQQAPYAGLETRAVSTLSAEDIAALEAGQGWGLALPAELNGYPGPAHVLDMADVLALSEGQRAGIEAVFAAMQAEARRLGANYIAAERAVDALFREGTATPNALAAAVAHAGETLAALRAVHLAAHLEVAPLLTRHQRHVYDDLRGYGSDAAAHRTHSGH
jgi:hypothetical protein